MVMYESDTKGCGMWIFLQSHVLLILLAVVLVVVTLLATIYNFSRRRNFEDGPRKGEAANPAKVKRQNVMRNR